MPKLTIVFTGSTTERYHPDSGGIQLAEYSFCESDKKEGWDKTVIFRGRSNEAVQSHNANLISIVTENLKLEGLADSTPFSLVSSATIDELGAKGEDCIHFTSLIPAMVYLDHPVNDYLRNKRNVIKSKFFYTIHNIQYGVVDKPEDIFVKYPEEWKYLHDAEYRVIDHVDEVFVTCKRYVSELSGKFNRNINYLPNTVGDISKYKIETNNRSKYKVVLTLCRLEKEKNLEKLILAFKKAKIVDENIRLVFGGEGSLLTSLITLCDKEGLKCRKETNLCVNERLESILDKCDIVFAGKVEGEEKRFLFESCDCIALFSFREICSLFGLEAIAYGKRILASKIPGWEDYQNFGADVLLSDPYNIEEITQTIIKGTADIKENSGSISGKNKNVYQKNYSPNIVSAIRYSYYEDSLRPDL